MRQSLPKVYSLFILQKYICQLTVVQVDAAVREKKLTLPQSTFHHSIAARPHRAEKDLGSFLTEHMCDVCRVVDSPNFQYEKTIFIFITQQKFCPVIPNGPYACELLF